QHYPLHPPHLHSSPTRRSSDLIVVQPHIWRLLCLNVKAAQNELIRNVNNQRFFVPANVQQKLALFAQPGGAPVGHLRAQGNGVEDRKSTRLNSSHVKISYAVFC